MHEVEPAAANGSGGDYVHTAALVSYSMLYTKDVLIGQQGPTPAFADPLPPLLPAAAEGRRRWLQLQEELLTPGVRHALLCGVMIQILQQFSGINGVLYYTPQILDQADVSVLLSGLGLSADSTSILISGVTTLLASASPCAGAYCSGPSPCRCPPPGGVAASSSTSAASSWASASSPTSCAPTSSRRASGASAPSPHLLARRHRRHLQPPRHAHLRQPRRSLWLLRRRLLLRARLGGKISHAPAG
jgi:hypothetical protein